MIIEIINKKIKNAVSLLLILTFFMLPSSCSFVSKEKPKNEMKTIGIIGGVSWVSSLEYYRLLNEKVNRELGGLHSAKIVMYSVEFGEFSKQERLAHMGDWSPLRKTMIDAAKSLESGGADFIIIASNTMNSTSGVIQEKVKIPVLHIADAAGARIKESGIKTAALLGTKFTMEQSFYRDILEKKYGIRVVTPNESERNYINDIIFNELCAGNFNSDAKSKFLRIIDRLAKENGAEGVILGCTEIPLLVNQKDIKIKVFDSMDIHTTAAVKFALSR